MQSSFTHTFRLMFVRVAHPAHHVSHPQHTSVRPPHLLFGHTYTRTLFCLCMQLCPCSVQYRTCVLFCLITHCRRSTVTGCGLSPFFPNRPVAFTLFFGIPCHSHSFSTHHLTPYPLSPAIALPPVPAERNRGDTRRQMTPLHTKIFRFGTFSTSTSCATLPPHSFSTTDHTKCYGAPRPPCLGQGWRLD